MITEIEATVKITIPEDKVMIDKVKYLELKQNDLVGRNWTMKDLENVTKRSREWILKNIIYQPRFKEELEPFVSHPKGKGGTWLFQASKMAEFLDRNFHKIFK